MSGLLAHIFTWWRDHTVGTWLYTKRNGKLVGEDDQGNTYYEDQKGRRRWVLYHGEIEASRIPPEWHRWLHYTADEPPTTAPLPLQSWEKPHLPNLTGTSGAYFPPGSLTSPKPRPRTTGEYEAWRPDEA